MRIVWIGPLVNPDYLNKYKGISPAANRWQLNLIIALMRKGVEVTCLSYLPDSGWPKGSFAPVFERHDSDFLVPVYPLRYLNVPLLRELSLFFSFKRWVKGQSFQYLVTYNPLKRHLMMGGFAQRSLAKPWISIVADGRPAGRPDFEVLLSHWSFTKTLSRRKLHLDGGIDVATLQRHERRDSKKIIIYAGALNRWTGIEKFVEQFSTLDVDDFELHIYGRNDGSELIQAISTTKNVYLKGFASDVEYQKACVECFAFVNPRPENIALGEFNFPSKILDYLGYGKPILSTMVPGMSNKYHDVLLTYKSDDVKSLRLAFEKLSSYTASEMLALRKKLIQFAESNTWDRRAEEFLEFVSSR